MKKYIWQTRGDGVNIFDVQKQWEKIQIAARIIASIPDPSTIIAVSGRLYGQRAVYKFGQHTKSVAVTGRWSPGMLTNQITKKFVEPRLLIVTDPRIDYNALVESSYVNIPVIALCNTDNNLAYVDCAIPCNNRSKRSLAMIYWLLTKEVLSLRGELEGGVFNELPDLFMYRNVEKKEEKEEEEPKEEEAGAPQEAPKEEEEGEEHFIEEEAA
jgi:small subunit ribosomal protein SAe